MRRPFYPVLLGMWVSNLIGILLVGLVQWLVQLRPDTSHVLVLSNFVIIPLLMGFLCAFFWRDVEAEPSDYNSWTAWNTVAALVVSYFVMAEGIICLVIVAPLIFCFLLGGVHLGRRAFRRGGRLRVSVVPLLLFLLLLDALAPHHHENMVSDSLTIRARPEQVWRYVVAVPPIRDRTGYWLFHIGLPRPLRTTVTAHSLGARRDCIFSGNLVFEERITELEPRRKVTFEVVREPDQPEIYRHLDLVRGQMLLADNGDGTTTLTGNTWYRLHVYPSWYYDLWAQDIARNVHLSVMRHIAALAEEDQN